MSTFYATFESTLKGRQAVDELLRDGVPPENISLIGDYHSGTGDGELTEGSDKLGDASFFVGRADDPERSPEAERRRLVARVPHVEGDEIGGPDTSNISLDVDSVDQADESQEIAEDNMYPFRGESYASREASDRETEMKTNFPTPPDRMDDVYDTETPLEDQNVDALETLSVAGRGVVIGAGALSTVALDMLDSSQARPSEKLYKYLLDEGVPRPEAEAYRRAVISGDALLAIEIVPGRTHENRVESVVELHGGQMANLFDARRFRDDGGSIHERVGGQS